MKKKKVLSRKKKKEEKKENNWIDVFEKKWEEKTKRISKKVTLIEHAFIVLLSLATGVIIYGIVLKILLPQTLPLPETTAINWLVLHKHSMMLDYIRFGLFVFIIPLSIVFGWIILLWRRNQ